MKYKVEPKPEIETSTLYARNVNKENIDFLRQEAGRLGYSFSEYLNQLFNSVRNSQKKKAG
jgi:flagellar hook-basal body complex protein FliE